MSSYYMKQKGMCCPGRGAVGTFIGGVCMLDGTNQCPTKDDIMAIKLRVENNCISRGDTTRPYRGTYDDETCYMFNPYNSCPLCKRRFTFRDGKCTIDGQLQFGLKSKKYCSIM